MSYQLVAVSGISIECLGIPKGSLRGSYKLCLDEGYVDRRCLRRYQRKYVRAMRRRYGDKFVTRLKVR